MTSNTSPFSILIVEDELSLRSALRDKFIREGFIVFDTKDGEAGLESALTEWPQLILLDIMMPKMDGITMLAMLRSTNEWGRQVPVFLLTNLGDDNKTVMKEIAKDSRTHYLVKSNWSIDQIVGKVRETISRTTAPDADYSVLV